MTRSGRQGTGWGRAVLTVLAVYGLLLQGLWAGVLPLRMAQPADPFTALLCTPSGAHGPAAPDAPGDSHQNSCCSLFCRAAMAGAAILPEAPLLAAAGRIAAADSGLPPDAPSRPFPRRAHGARAPPLTA